MFKHIYLYRLKYLLRLRAALFWTILFPIVLATFFNFAFANLKETIDPIDVAVIDEFKNNQAFTSMIDSLNENGDNKLLNVKYVEEEEALQLLNDKEIKAVITVKEDIDLVVAGTGIEETVLKSILDNYKQTMEIVSVVSVENPEALNDLINELGNKENYIKDVTSDNNDSRVIYFYSLIGMSVVYAGFFGISAITETQANLSHRAKRLAISPVNKLSSLIASLLAGFTIHFISIMLLLFYLIVILNKDFGNNIPYIILLCFVGSFAGIGLGTFVAASNKLKEDTKIGLYSMISLALSFLSGMMYIDMKYIIAKNVPVLANINPVTLITDALYSLYYYDTYTRFFTNIMYLSIISAVLIFGTYLIIRGRKYESL